MTARRLLERLLAAFHVDFEPAARIPGAGLLVLAMLLAIAGCLGADALIVRAGEALFPATRGYSHFRFSDYATLTLIGVAIAAPVWPIAVRVSSTPRWLYFRLAVIVTALLWLPDLYLLVKGEPPRAVLVLMAMHVAIALVAYNLLVHVAPPRRWAADEPPVTTSRSLSDPVPGTRREGEPAARLITSRHWPWIALMVGVCLEFVAGIATLFVVPFSRPNAWLPPQHQAVYLAHAVLGALLVLAALELVVQARKAKRRVLLAAVLGLSGIVIAGIGGILAVDHGLRLLGMGLMFVGSGVGFFGYLVPLVEETPLEDSVEVAS